MIADFVHTLKWIYSCSQTLNSGHFPELFRRGRKCCFRMVSGIFLLLWKRRTQTISCCVIHMWTANSGSGPGAIFRTISRVRVWIQLMREKHWTHILQAMSTTSSYKCGCVWAGFVETPLFYYHGLSPGCRPCACAPRPQCPSVCHTNAPFIPVGGRELRQMVNTGSVFQ